MLGAWRTLLPELVEALRNLILTHGQWGAILLWSALKTKTAVAGGVEGDRGGLEERVEWKRVDTFEVMGMALTKSTRDSGVVPTRSRAHKLSFVPNLVPIKWKSQTHIRRGSEKIGDLLKVTLLFEPGGGIPSWTCLWSPCSSKSLSSGARL